MDGLPMPPGPHPSQAGLEGAGCTASDPTDAPDLPLVTFHRVLPGLPPRRAGRDAAGTLPHRAVQYCVPSAVASAFGYHVFLPASFSVIWDGGSGAEFALHDADQEDIWFPLTEVAFPHSIAAWDAIAPPGCQGFCPPWIQLTEIPGVLQIWTGWLVETRADTSVLVRAPANFAPPSGYQVLDGVIDTDQWFGPLFALIRLTRTDRPVRFDALWPFLQVQPLPRAAFADGTLKHYSVTEAADMPESRWAAYEESMVLPAVRRSEAGGRANYARKARKRSRRDPESPTASGCPLHSGSRRNEP